ncbi:50S ribosomal protein L24e [Nanoarchaeota archaeon]
MARCSFCGKVFPKGTGVMYVKKDGKILYFHAKKCEKNMFKLKRKPRQTRWTKEYQDIKKGQKV